MVTKEVIIQTVFKAIDKTNPLLSTEQQLEKSIDTVLLGDSGKLDSLGLINFIVSVEEQFEEDLGLIITLSDEQAMSSQQGTFETIGTLITYVSLLLETETNES